MNIIIFAFFSFILVTLVYIKYYSLIPKKCTYFYTSCSKEYIQRINRKMILVTLVSESYLDIAINFYLTLIKKYNINNYLYISTDNISITKLRELNIIY